MYFSGSEIERGVLTGIQWDFSTSTNPYEVAYDNIKLQTGMEELIDC